MNKKKMALRAVHETVARLSESEIRRHIYVKALQSDRFTVFIGSAKVTFRVPQELLIQYSSVFKKMCISPFKESIEKTIKLPEEDPATFMNFFIWLHALEPCITINEIAPVIDLAIFAEKYDVRFLKNQTSDFIRAALTNDRLRITPEIITTVYSSVPAGTTLRQICSLVFAANYSRRNTATERSAEWEKIFSEFPELGWDYFQHIQKDKTDVSSIKLGGACRFHDHSDDSGWIGRVRGSESKCPYPYGVPPKERDYEKLFRDTVEEPIDKRTDEVGVMDEMHVGHADEHIDLVDEIPQYPPWGHEIDTVGNLIEPEDDIY